MLNSVVKDLVNPMATNASLINVSADPFAGYTATMQFLATPAGQKVAEGITDVIIDLINLFHKKNGGTPPPNPSSTTTTTTVTTGTSTKP